VIGLVHETYSAARLHSLSPVFAEFRVVFVAQHPPARLLMMARRFGDFGGHLEKRARADPERQPPCL
jgi:hypothetical protein